MAIGRDDFSLSRVPTSARFGFWPMLLQWLAQSGSLSQFVLGATIGVSMTITNAFIAFTIGAVVLEIVIFAIGVAGQREGMGMSLLTRFVALGARGSAVVSALTVVSLIGWFGIQDGILADSVAKLIGGKSWIWALAGGGVLTALVLYGFRIMIWIANIAVPLFFSLVAFNIIQAFQGHTLSALLHIEPSGHIITIPAAATIIAGGFIAGAIGAPDTTRFNKRWWHVAVQSSCSLVLSEYVVALTGVLLAHVYGSGNVASIVSGSSGVVGLLIITLSTMKINDYNLYSATLALVNFIQVTFDRRLHRGLATILIGAIGSAAAAVGILDHFKSFLAILGIAIPPLAGIIVAEYWIVRRMRGPLDETRIGGTTPVSCVSWVPATFVCWIGGTIVGAAVPIGVSTINALVAGLVMYAALGRAGWIRPRGITTVANS